MRQMRHLPLFWGMMHQAVGGMVALNWMVSSQPQDVLWGTSCPHRIADPVSRHIYTVTCTRTIASRNANAGDWGFPYRQVAIVLADLLRCDVGKLSVLGPSDRQKYKATRRPRHHPRPANSPAKQRGSRPSHSDGLLTGNGHFGGGDRGRAWRRCWRLVTRAEAGTLKCLARAVFGSMAGRFTALVAMLYWRL